MQRQLALLELDRREWKLDERTRQVGRTGIARAREALRGSAGGHDSPRRDLGAEAGAGGCATGAEALRRAARPPAA